MAILFGESDATHYEQAISSGVAQAHVRRSRCSKQPWLSRARRGAGGGTSTRSCCWTEAEIELAPVTPVHVEAARRAWRRFGKGNHRAALNLGDCLAYALAKTTGEPLLFKGDDFAHTDIEVGVSRPDANRLGVTA